MGHDQAAVDDQQLCDDGSILISAVQSAVTHLIFGHESSDHDLVVNNGIDDAAANKNNDPFKEGGNDCPSPTLTTAESSSSDSFTSSSFLRNPITITGRARSMSPSLLSPTASSLHENQHHQQQNNNNALLFCGDHHNSRPNYYYGTYSGDSGEMNNNNFDYSYFDTSDFTAQTWLNVLQETDTIHYCGAGAAILTAVIVIHPLALLGAAATAAVGASAAWVVGLFHDLDKGYQIWNNDDFKMIFWEEAMNNIDNNTTTSTSSLSCGGIPAAIATVGSQQIIQENEVGLRKAFLLEREQSNNLLEKNEDRVGGEVGEVGHDYDDDDAHNKQHHDNKIQATIATLQDTNRIIRVHSAPLAKMLPIRSSGKSTYQQKQQQQQPLQLLPPRHQSKVTQHPTTLPPSILSTKQSVDRHYPPLEVGVVSEVELHGLNTLEFFQVFFSDDAPYSMKDFQKTRGDVDIVYGTWKEVTDLHDLSSFKKVKPGLLPLPSSSTQERTLTFNTLTKSYFGPAYAKATKIQRATRLNKHLLIIENETRLSEIPFADKFMVLERWIIESVKKNESNDGGGSGGGGGGGGGGGLYTCKLTVHAEVIMLGSCRFESQIRKKASETFTEVTMEWCKLATKALEATREQKRKRMRNEEHQYDDDDDRNDSSIVGDDTQQQEVESKKKLHRETESSELFAKHQQKFQELDDLIANSGDDNIEVLHSIEAGAHSAFAKVLLPAESGLIKLKDGTVVEVARRSADAKKKLLNKRMSRQLSDSFRRFSSRVRSPSRSR